MNYNIFRKQRKIAVVTGATGGLGRNLIQPLLNHHYDIIIVGRNQTQLQQVVNQYGQRITACICDISRPEEIQYLCEDIRIRFGSIHALIHCAGMIYPGAFILQSETTILEQIQTNLTGTILLTRGLVPLMNKGSSIIFINSLGGLMPLKNSALYSASKFGLRGFALALSMELKSRRISVSSIFPAAIDTHMLHREIEEGGSMLNFCSPPLPVHAVCRTIIKALYQKKLEYYLPRSSAIQIKAMMLKPALIKLLMPIMERIGKKGYKEWNKSRNL